MSTNDVVRKLWALCSVLRDDGISYQDYLSELTYLLFLKLASELRVEDSLPSGCRWSNLEKKKNIEIDQYKAILVELAHSSDSQVRSIFGDSYSNIRSSDNLRRLILGISSIEWYREDRDSLGDIYEGLIEKSSTESRYGAGQYFTPRALVTAIVDVMQPQPHDKVYDPAAGTGGFLVEAGSRFDKNAGPTLVGRELVRNVQRMAEMNLQLHWLDGQIELGDSLDVETSSVAANLCISNPPFGIKGGLSQHQQALLQFPTNNKQLAFLQHIVNSLDSGGRAAVIVPDNVLFEFGVASQVRTQLLDHYNLHTVLRLPAGIFYATGVKTSVLFFENTQRMATETWFYDLRGNSTSVGYSKRRPLKTRDLKEFLDLFRTGQDSVRHQPIDRQYLESVGNRLDLPVKEVYEHSNHGEGPEEMTAVIVREIEQALAAAQGLADILREERFSK